jgi:NitT/TauT family transport system substrate-binding protein
MSIQSRDGVIVVSLPEFVAYFGVIRGRGPGRLASPNFMRFYRVALTSASHDRRSAIMTPSHLRRALTASLMAAFVSLAPVRAETLDKVTFGTNWVAEAEHGGFFQAVADGTYKKYVLDVTIVPGGPNENNRMLLIAGKIDFFMAANTLMSFDAVANNVPVVTIAAVFQKDPQVMLTQPDAKVAKIEDLKPLTLFVSKEGMTSYFQWLKSEYGFNEKNVRPYNFNPQPFIANPKSAMQGYVTSEPFAVEKAAGFKPNVLLLADYGFNTYSTLIETRRDMVEKKPDLVQRFVDASMVGWYNYIYRDNSAGNAMIKKLNPEMTDELLAYSVAKMKEYGIVDSGESLKNGIGAMSDERYTSFFNKMVKAGVVKADLDFRKSYTLRFVNKGVGVELRPSKP